MPKTLLKLVVILPVLGILLAACDSDTQPLPTQADFESVATAEYLTSVAPPVGFSEVQFPAIDQQLDQIAHARFTVNVSFAGIYDDTGEATQGSMALEGYTNQLAVSRQIEIEFDGDVFSGGASNLLAVRVSNSYYMINPNGVCITDAGQIAEIANLTAGQLIGGVNLAGHTGQSTTINGYQVWQYGFAPEALVEPQVQTTADLDLLTGEVWVAPEYQIVVRYIVEMNVQGAKLLFGERAVTGRVRYEYNVYDLNVEHNISVPNGC